MGTADEAWLDSDVTFFTDQKVAFKAGFAAGQVAALTEAADEMDHEGNLYIEELLRINDGLPITGMSVIESGRRFIAQARTEPADWLRARAVAVKDGSEG